ncbi:MAG TPA: ATP-binding cassette domain-containing protein [Bryobacteraceae bacterium]|nr:ATP-binding cassette domain-containing protein [Bryobacteraceae bacterium]
MIEARVVKRFAGGRESAPFTLDIDLTATAGITALFGPSGAGKTLTLDCIAGFVRPDEGRILLADRLVFDAQAGVHLSPQRRRCGYVVQNYSLFPHMTLRENLAFAAERLPRIERHRKIGDMLDRFRLAEVAGRRPHELSGGQKQRCSVARALIGGPAVLLLDEPARGLDAPLRVELYEVLRQVRAEFGTPVLLVTHSLEEAFELAGEMIVIDNGRIAQAGTPSAVCDQPASVEVARLLGIFNILPVEIRMLDPSRNASVLRYGDADIAGAYYPGHLIGDRVHVCVTPQALRVVPRNGRPAPNQVPVQLARTIERAGAVRLDFEGGVTAELTREEFERMRHVRDWLIEFPASTLRIV